MVLASAEKLSRGASHSPVERTVDLFKPTPGPIKIGADHCGCASSGRVLRKAHDVRKPSGEGSSRRKRLTTHQSRPCGSVQRWPSPVRPLSTGSGWKTATGSDHVL